MKPTKAINVHAHFSAARQDMEKRIKHYDRPWILRTFLLGPEDDVIAAQEAAPDKICAFPHMGLGEVRLDDFKRARDRGAKGFKFIAANNRLPYDDPQFWPLYEQIQAWGMPIVFHTGYLGHAPGKPQPDVRCMSMHPFTLDTIARNFDELNIIGAHLGQPWCNEACVLSWKHPHLYWDLSGGTVRGRPASWWKSLTATSAEPELRSLEEKVDLEIVRKWVFGTDNPSPDIYSVFYDNLTRLLDVPEDICEDIYWRNAGRMLGLTEDGL